MIPWVAPNGFGMFLVIVGVVVLAMLLRNASAHRRYSQQTMQRLCRDCGASHPRFAVFCRKCGRRL